MTALISRCLLGVACRYHGRNVTTWGKPTGRPGLVAKLQAKGVTLIPICPECDGGMPTPRPPTRIVGGRWVCDGEDVTEQFARGTALAVEAAKRSWATEAWLLKGSPACDPTCGMTGSALTKLGLLCHSV
jgi:uncharacterized protein YbbK (DUF523 family)